MPKPLPYDYGGGLLFNYSNQFRKLWSGAGMRPPRWMKSALDSLCTGMTGALPSRPPNATVSPTVLPVNRCSAADFIARGGRIPAPLHSLKN